MKLKPTADTTEYMSCGKKAISHRENTEYIRRLSLKDVHVNSLSSYCMVK